MANDARTALLLGATGMVGRSLLQLLLDDPGVEHVHILVRRSLGITHPKLTEWLTDLVKLPEDDTPFRCSDLYISFGSTMAKAGSKDAFRQIDLDMPLHVARRARKAGALRCMLVSAVGADKDSMIFYSRVKGELEEGLKALSFRALHVFRPSILLGDRRESRPAEAVGMWLGKWQHRLFPGLLGTWSAMPDRLLAQAMIGASRSGQAGTHIHHYRETAQMVRNNPS